MGRCTHHFTSIGVIVGCLGFTLISGYWLWEFSTFYQQPMGKRFSELWARDVERLTSAGVFPRGINDLRTYELVAATDRALEWKSELSIPFSTAPKGHFHLEILLLSWEEGPKEGAIVQYNLVDLRSKDMTWELGRTFVLLGEHPFEETVARQMSAILGKIKSNPSP